MVNHQHTENGHPIAVNISLFLLFLLFLPWQTGICIGHSKDASHAEFELYGNEDVFKGPIFDHSTDSVAGVAITEHDMSLPNVRRYNGSGLLLFMHFHKAGGSTITYYFRTHFTPAKSHRAGNPWSNNKIITFWKYDNAKFMEFTHKLESSGTQYISMEWNFFSHYDELDLSKVHLFTCFRNPFTRFRSNYLVKKRKKGPKQWSKQELWWSRNGVKQHFAQNTNHMNYYVMMLNGLGDQPSLKATRKHLQVAKKRLSLFDAVVILEEPESFHLFNQFGIIWDWKVIEKRNVNNGTGGDKAKFAMTESEFRTLNELDYELYEYARNLSHKMQKLINL